MGRGLWEALHPRLAPGGGAGAHTGGGSGERPARLSPGTGPRWTDGHRTSNGPGHVRPPLDRPSSHRTGFCAPPSPRPRPPAPDPVPSQRPGHTASPSPGDGGRSVPERNSSRGDCASSVENEIKTGMEGEGLWGRETALGRQEPVHQGHHRPRAGRAQGRTVKPEALWGLEEKGSVRSSRPQSTHPFPGAEAVSVWTDAPSSRPGAGRPRWAHRPPPPLCRISRCPAQHRGGRPGGAVLRVWGALWAASLWGPHSGGPAPGPPEVSGLETGAIFTRTSAPPT